MPVNSSIQVPIITVIDDGAVKRSDALAVEEPLEIRLEYGPKENRQVKNISVTMRTPGNDAELAAGFLFTEGIIRTREDILSAGHCFTGCNENKENVIEVKLKEDVTPNLSNTERNFYTTSSCGVCGKASIGAIKTVSALRTSSTANAIAAEILCQLPETLKQHQQVFADTGGLHASALFDKKGSLLMVREDVGRHNALDKLIGASLKEGMVPLDQHILLLSGRASFELVQKAAMAGINIIAAVGAPSSLAVQLAEEFNITLIGFLRGNRFNIYSVENRVLMNTYEDSY
ncbi:MAG TPA: formate dehydrogenase accessory sulfurtransferase FdhD [Mucilaginibacter sp.]|nr:formate dehydrogenase accessory sulfurtransferase FdhD [Mucilaginibacter sp.]